MIQEIAATLIQINEETLDEVVKLLNSHTASRIWICGNGGSASASQHFSSDLLNVGYDVVCLNDNLARISAISNDYGFDKIYEHQMWHFKVDDILIVFSVHGGAMRKGEVWSSNLVKACEFAKKKQGIVVALLGGYDGAIKGLADYSIMVPHEKAFAVEGLHSVISHLICHKLSELRGNDLEV